MSKTGNYQKPNRSKESIPARTNRRGFTLIELLVVIAIIALLVSILLPSLNHAKELAKQLQCMTNLKALGTAFNFYFQDNEMFPPNLNPITTDSGIEYLSWYELLEEYDLLHVSLLATESVWPEVSTRQIHCPSWDPASMPYGYGCCYGYNQHFYNASDFKYLKNPSGQTVIIGETHGGSILISEVEDYERYEPDYRHINDRTVFMWSDSHAEPRTTNEVPFSAWGEMFWDPGANN